MLYQRGHEKRFRDGAVAAVRWLRHVRLKDGTWARFYELRTDRPLYVNTKNEVTYDDGDLLGHYTLRSMFEIPEALRLSDEAEGGTMTPAKRYWQSPSDGLDNAALEHEVEKLIAAQDGEGRWIEGGWVKSQTFVDAILTLARYVGEKAR